MIDPGTIRRLQKELHDRIERNRDTLSEQTVDGTAGGGVVTVVCNGNQEVTEVRIKPEAVDPDDVEMLQDLILAATNQAMEKAKKLHEDSVSEITGGLKFPGLF